MGRFLLRRSKGNFTYEGELLVAPVVVDDSRGVEEDAVLRILVVGLVRSPVSKFHAGKRSTCGEEEAVS